MFTGIKDSILVNFGALSAGKGEYFSDNTESPRFEELSQNISVSSFDIPTEGTFLVPVKTPAGEMTATVTVHRWIQGAPVMVYFPPFGDFACRSASKIFLEGHIQFNASIITVVPPYCYDSNEYATAVRDIRTFMCILLSAAATAEAIIEKLKGEKQRTYLCGLSLGGWIINLHHSLYNSAFAYIPILAGAGLGNFFFDSKGKALLSKRAKFDADRVRRLLNFDDIFMGQGHHSNMFPLFASHDNFVRPVRQRTSYGDISIAYMSRAHSSALASFKRIRNHMLSVFDKNRFRHP